MDLSAYASLYSDIIKREGDVATNQITKTILTRATGKMKLYDRDPEQFKVTIAERLRSQAGLSVAPEDIIVDKKKGVSIAPNASTSSASAPNAMTPVMVRDKTTGKLIRALKDASGKLYPAN